MQFFDDNKVINVCLRNKRDLLQYEAQKFFRSSRRNRFTTIDRPLRHARAGFRLS